VQALEHRQREARRLAGARLGAGHNVAPVEDGGNRLHLHRRGLGVALLGDGTAQFGQQAEESNDIEWVLV